MLLRATVRHCRLRAVCVSVAALLLLVTHAACQAQRQEIDLTGATVVDTRGDWGHHIIAQGEQPDVILDGDTETAWWSGAQTLTAVPANLLINLAEPVTLGRMEVTTVISKDILRLSDFEVYAKADDGWAMLGQVEGNEELAIELDLIPARVQELRIRVRRCAQSQNAWAAIATLRLFAPADETELVLLTPGDIPDETHNERVYLREALGLRGREPSTTYDPEIGYLGYVTSFLDTMIEKGTDRYGEVHSPMFVGMLETDTHEHPGGYIPSIPGQRWGDRPFWGGNLSHDRPLLEAMEYVSEYTGDARYREAAHAYLEFFLDNCTDTPTGLWPWGEHVYWDHYREAHSTDRLEHESEGCAPFTFWETAWEMKPDAVLGEASGLINHVFDLGTFAFCRHADITKVLPEPRPEGLRGLDFASVGQRFMRIWAFAWSKSGDERFYGWIERIADYWEDVRLEESGMLPVLSQYAWRPALRPNEASTLSVGLVMLESADLLEGTELAERLRSQGVEYVDWVASQGFTPPEEVGFDSAYGAAYSILSRQAERPVIPFVGNHTRMLAYRMTGDERHLEAARGVADAYAAIEEVPELDHLRAGVFGQLIHMMLDMHEFDRDPRWLEAAEMYGQAAVERFYSNGLFRGATNQWIYDSHLYPASLVHGLVRLHSVVEQEEIQAPPLYYHR
ncbi:MAG: hypothetical protein ACQER1_13125 [Armatimonadota bacterium]